YDAVESGSGAPHTSGVLVGNIFGANGLADILETSANSGVLNYTIRDTDGDGSYNAVDHDSDADLCNDVREAGYNDGNNNGYLGNSATPTVNSNGVVTGAGGYTVPNANYLIPVPIEITDDVPVEITICENSNANLSIITNSD